MGVLGSEDTNGDFKVVDVCYAGEGAQEQPAPMETGKSETQNTLKSSQRSSVLLYPLYHFILDEADKYVALVSGLGIGGNDFKPLELDLLAEYLTGELGNTKVQDQ